MKYPLGVLCYSTNQRVGIRLFRRRTDADLQCIARTELQRVDCAYEAAGVMYDLGYVGVEWGV